MGTFELARYLASQEGFWGGYLYPGARVSGLQGLQQTCSGSKPEHVDRRPFADLWSANAEILAWAPIGAQVEIDSTTGSNQWSETWKKVSAHSWALTWRWEEGEEWEESHSPR